MIHGMMMQERNIYKDVPIALIKGYILNRIDDIDEKTLTRVYETLSSNTCLQKTKENCINIIVNKEHDWN